MKKMKIAIFILTFCFIFTGCNKKAQQAESTDIVNEITEETAITDDVAGEADDDNNAESVENAEESDENLTSEADGIRPIQSKISSTYKAFYNDAKASGTVYEYTFNKVSLNEESAKKYPLLQKALEETYAGVEANVIGNAERNMEDAIDWCVNYADGEYDYHFDETVKAEVIRADTNIFSARNNFYEFMGGAHGNYGYYSNTFDTETGKELTLTDVFTSKEELKTTIYNKLIEQYGEDAFYGTDELKDTIDTHVDRGSLIFDIDYSSVNIFFNPYDIAPYAGGLFEVNLPLKEYCGNLVYDRFVETPEEFICPIPNGDDFYMDLDGSGREDIIKCISEYSEDDYDYIDNINISVNGKSFSHSTYAFDIDYYFVKSKGKYYVYGFCHIENDYVYPVVFDINGSTPKLVEAPENFPGIQPAGKFCDSEYNDDFHEYTTEEYVLSDPENMLMSLRSDVMSTASAYGDFEVSENGFPVYKYEGKPFSINSDDYVFTAKQDLEGMQVDEDGNEIGKFTLKAGTKATYYRTDNVSYGDLLLDDGTIVRFNVDHSDWPVTVNGIDLEEAFDGIVFAG